MRLVVVGGRAGRAWRPPSRPAQSGHEVVLLERRAQARRPGRARRRRSRPRRAGAVVAEERRAAARPGRSRRAARRPKRTRTRLLDLDPEAVVVATGARPFTTRTRARGNPGRCRPGRCSLGRSRRASASSSPTGAATPPGSTAPRCSTAAGNDVTVALAAITAGESMHQYARNLYLGRLYRAGVRIQHHVELTGARAGAVEFRNLFAPELELRARGRSPRARARSRARERALPRS